MMRTARSLRPFMRRDEHLLEYDIADVGGIGYNIPVVLSGRAIYMPSAAIAATVRIPYEEIVSVEARGRNRIAFQTKTFNVYLIEIKGAPRGDIYQTITQHLDNLARFDRWVTVAGGQVHATLRPLTEDGPLVWALFQTEGVDLAAPHVRAQLEAELTDAIAQFGIQLPW